MLNFLKNRLEDINGIYVFIATWLNTTVLCEWEPLNLSLNPTIVGRSILQFVKGYRLSKAHFAIDFYLYIIDSKCELELGFSLSFGEKWRYTSVGATKWGVILILVETWNATGSGVPF